MKKLILSFGALIATVVFLGTPAQAETFAVKRVIEVPGYSKEKILDKVSGWSGRYLSDHKTDKNSGAIIANGEIAYPSPPENRIQYTIVFKMKNTVQDNRVAVAFDEVMLKSPETYTSLNTGAFSPFIGGETAPVESGKDIAAANKALNLLADNLERFLLGKEESGSPLMQCPHCRLLGASPEEMKEHMQRHEHITGQGTAPKP
jgi:hypothetical protein